MYKSKETAIKHIRNGENFANKVFDFVRNDREVILEAVRMDGGALEHASKKGKGDREIVLEAIKTDGAKEIPSGVLRYAEEKLREDRDVVLAAVRCNGIELQYAEEKLREDREVVLEAVRRSHGFALIYASKELLKDREVVLEATRMLGTKILLLWGELGSDVEVVLEVVRKERVWPLRCCNISKEIINIVGGGDPVEMLKDYIEKKALRESLTKQTSEKEANTKRRKGGI